jgi:hypothetical protein
MKTRMVCIIVTMIEKFELLISLTFMVAHFAMAATMGDFFHFNKEAVINIGKTTPITCTVYSGEAYNVYGSLCGQRIASFEKYMMTLQILLPSGFGFSLVLFFLVLFRRMRKNTIRLTAGIILVIEMSACILWQVSDRSYLPIDDKIISYYGAGWIMTIATMIFSVLIIIVV